MILLVTASSHTNKSINRLLTDQFKVVNAESASDAWYSLWKELSISLLVGELDKAIDETALVERIRRAEDRKLAGLPVLLLNQIPDLVNELLPLLEFIKQNNTQEYHKILAIAEDGP